MEAHRFANMPLPERPDARDGTQQGALARSRWSLYQHARSRLDRQPRLRQQTFAGRQAQLEISTCSASRGTFAHLHAGMQLLVAMRGLDRPMESDQSDPPSPSTARMPDTLMNQDSDSRTNPNALAVCINPPSGMAPEKKRGAATTNGKITASCP